MSNAITKNKYYIVRRLLPVAMPFIVGILLYATVLVPLISPIARFWILLLIYVALIVITSSLIMIAAAQQTQIARWRLLLPALLLTSGSFLTHLLVGSTFARYIIVTITMLLLFSLIMRLDQSHVLSDEELSSTLRYMRLISLIGIFLSYLFAFGVYQFIQLPFFLPAIILGAIFCLVSYEALLEVKISSRFRWLVSIVSGSIGIEAFLGLSFLPTSYIVNAAVLLVVQFSFLRLVLVALIGSPTDKRLAKIGVVIALLLIVLVLVTARWN